MSDHGAPEHDQAPGPDPLGPARCFGPVADAYERGRPGYPAEAAAWLAGTEPCTVLEIGAGTGKLTAELVALGHDVHATDPDPAMLDLLSRRLPDVPVTVAAAEDLPVGDATYDVVVCAQAFHWCDAERALPEIARVLRPGGRLALAWNAADRRIPWVRRLHTVLGEAEHRDDLLDPVIASSLFGIVDKSSFAHWQRVDRESVADLALSRSTIASLPAQERAEQVARVVAFYDDYGRGMDGMQLPYDAHCYRARVADDLRRAPADDAATAGTDGHAPAGAQPDPRPPAGSRPMPAATISDGTGTDLLLIDFR